MVLILGNVLRLKLAHALDFVEINDEAIVVTIIRFNTLSTEYRLILATVEVLHTLRVLFTELLTESFFILIFEVEGDLAENRVFFDDLIEDVDVQWKSLGTFELLDQFPANWASYSFLVVQLLNAARAKSVATVDKYAWNAFTHVVLESTESADVKLASFVI